MNNLCEMEALFFYIELLHYKLYIINTYVFSHPAYYPLDVAHDNQWCVLQAQ